MDERTPVEVNSGIDQRSNDYIDGVNDMILYLGGFDLAKENHRQRLEQAVNRISADIDAIKQIRFIRANMLHNLEW